ncbi:MAG TPA: hypothetical protein VLQ45_18270 [Thermoanaerobaculia bacterium]|nr:hypothetical protein [Thermoanaerobaculia bacterium]
MILAQAVPPVWMLLLSMYVLFGVPLSFWLSVGAFALSLSGKRKKPFVRWLCRAALGMSFVSGVIVYLFLRNNHNPTPLGTEERWWAVMFAGAFILSAAAVWRSLPEPGSRQVKGS